MNVKPVEMSILYGIFAALGIVAIILGIPTFSLTLTGLFTPAWGLVMFLSGVTAALSILLKWKWRERISVLLVVLLVGFYIAAALNLISQGGEAARDRGSFGVVLMTMIWFPVIHSMRAWKRKKSPQDDA